MMVMMTVNIAGNQWWWRYWRPGCCDITFEINLAGWWWRWSWWWWWWWWLVDPWCLTCPNELDKKQEEGDLYIFLKKEENAKIAFYIRLIKMLIDADWHWPMLIDAEWYAYWSWLKLTNADWCCLMLIDVDWYCLMLMDADWCWLMLK